MTSNKIKGIIFVLLGTSSYGLVSPLTKLAYDDGLGYKEVSAGMALIGVLFFTAALWIRKESLQSVKGNVARLAVVGAVGIGMTTLMLNKSLETLDASTAIVLLFQFTWMVVLLDYFIGGIRPTLWRWVSIALILTGTVFSVGMVGEMPESFTYIGMIYGLLSAVSYAVFLYFIGRIAVDASEMVRSTVMTGAAFLLIGANFLWGGTETLLDANWGLVLFWSVLLGCFGPILPTLFISKGSPHIGGGLTGVLGSIELPVAVVASALLLGESISILQWSGIALILLGIVLAERK